MAAHPALRHALTHQVAKLDVASPLCYRLDKDREAPI